METAQTAKALFGNKLYQQRAREALPILVRQATANQIISYSDLATELRMPNARNLNFVLGSIGQTMQQLSEEWNEEIPPINCLVCNKTTGLPGEGVGMFVSNKDFSKLPRKQQQAIVNAQLHKVFAYPYWNKVLAHLNLTPQSVPDYSSLFEAIHNKRGVDGESQFHLNLKNYIRSNPDAVGLPKNTTGETEYPLPSGDRVDVLFKLEKECVAVEVKSRISDTSDIFRGLFQCVKYRAVIEAFQVVRGDQSSCRVLLALESKLPAELLQMKNTLGIEVIEQITPKKSSVSEYLYFTPLPPGSFFLFLVFSFPGSTWERSFGGSTSIAARSESAFSAPLR
ncbi:MAG: hypothetical protein WBV73_04765, partial [Phormidium sp.]